MSTSPVIFAIDPGLDGAWAAITYYGIFMEAGELPRFSSMLDGVALRRLIDKFKPRQGVIERVHSMPKQGVASAFTFGCAYGISVGVMAGAMMPTAYVTPQKWKSHFRLIGAEKDGSVQRAVQLFPEAGTFLTLKKHHGRADAILLARYFYDMALKGEFV
jgi:Holliday junction resolvasome RuvABC endonuclease subunit